MKNDSKQGSVDQQRRRLLGAAGGSVLAPMFGGLMTTSIASAEDRPTIRWGFVGTGGIANSMARVVKTTPMAGLAAVSSRRMETAREFAETHSVESAFDSWQDMSAWDGVDAIYVATPTSVREEICVAAANGAQTRR